MAAKSLDDMTEPELREAMNGAADALQRSLPAGSLFVILASGASRIGHYVANIRRESIVRFLREAADRLESREDVTR